LDANDTTSSRLPETSNQCEESNRLCCIFRLIHRIHPMLSILLRMIKLYN